MVVIGVHALLLRAILSFFIAFAFSVFFGSWFIKRLKQYQIGQAIRDDGPQAHLKKSGTPTMGGLIILKAMLLALILTGDWSNPYLWVAVLSTVAFSAIGFVDDYRKVIQKNSKGLAARWKFLFQSLFAILISLIYYFIPQSANQFLFIPFLKLSLSIGAYFILISYLTIVGATNAANLTDGLDGLAIFPIALIALAFAFLAYFIGNQGLSLQIHLPYVPHAEELVVFCCALAGAGLGFLWFNAYPAEVFMGDVGSLGLGAALGVVAVILRQELLLFLMGGILVAETLSVILQVASFKLTRKRIFKMSPLHHHFELSGWSESKVIIRFWIITILLVIIGLSSLL